MNLNNAGEEIACSWIAVFVRNLGGAPHFADHDEQMSTCFFDRLTHRRVGRGDGHAGEVGGFQQMPRRILADYADALCEFVECW